MKTHVEAELSREGLMALYRRMVLIRQMEDHVERRFHTPALLEGL